jgi:hypothetical protein
VKINHGGFGMPWHVEVFTLSSGVWNVIPTGNLPRQTIRLANFDNSTQVVIDRFIYWGAYEETFTDDNFLKKFNTNLYLPLLSASEFNTKIPSHLSLTKPKINTPREFVVTEQKLINQT